MNTNDLISKNIIQAVKNTIEKHSLIKKGDAVLVALSGGADSVCMLHILCHLKDEFELKIAAAHLNHMIRGREADSDEAYAAELCTKLGIPFYAERVSIPELSKKEGISEELAGRKARYDFFERICNLYGYNKIATAHNRNDKAETVLMRVIRGTGIDGLCGIKHKRGDVIIRPILDILRSDIEKYCEENNLEYCTDSTNNETEYTRNRVRKELIPFIQEKFNPSVIEALCVLADNSTEDADFINGYAERLYNRINNPMPKKKPTIVDIKTLDMVDIGIQNRIIRIAAREVMGSDYSLERVHTDAVRSLFKKETGSSVSLPGGLVACVKYGWIEFKTQKEAEEDADTKEFLYSVEIGNALPSGAPHIEFSVAENGYSPKRNQMILDYDKLEGKRLTLRNRRMGDRMVFFKDGRTRKIKDYFIDKKIPIKERNEIPLLCADDEVVAIIGERVSEKFKISENTKRGLVVTYEPKNENR